MRAPSGENFAAFDSRLPITCVSLTGSPSTFSGCGGGSNVTLCRRAGDQRPRAFERVLDDFLHDQALRAAARSCRG